MSHEHDHEFGRREFLRLSAAGLGGLSLGTSLLAQPHSGLLLPTGPTWRPGKAKACILIWLDGGASHLETFDPKPSAPAEVRGPFDSIKTKVPGVRINQYMPRTAAMLDKIAVVRSMTSPFGVHNFGLQYAMTGYRPTPAVEYATMGSVVAHVRSVVQKRDLGVLPSNIAIPDLVSRDGATIGKGFLPSTASPFALGSDPGRSDFEVRDLDFREGFGGKRTERRRRFADALDRFHKKNDATPGPKTDPDLQRAYDLVVSDEAKQVFDLSQEKPALRKRYGIDHRANVHDANNIGQQCLLARRLVERGVPFVTVNNTGWDNHFNLETYKNRHPGDAKDEGTHALVPGLDKAFSGLVQDLKDRGMLDETLVVVMTEFGRTPKINSIGGRDHWPNCFSAALAGGGVPGGAVIGASDDLGEFVKDRPITPSDMAATIYTLLGIDPSLELQTADGRPIRLAPNGAAPIKELV
jgi:hypothetical protein